MLQYPIMIIPFADNRDFQIVYCRTGTAQQNVQIHLVNVEIVFRPNQTEWPGLIQFGLRRVSSSRTSKTVAIANFEQPISKS